MPVIDAIVDVWNEALDIWAKGGWAMWVIAVISLLLFGLGIHAWLALRATRFASVDEDTWRYWIENPAERHGPVGEMLDFVGDADTLEVSGTRFDQLRATETAPIERDLKLMKTFVGAAPLVGLLGTVTGMLSTFGALSSGSGGDQTMGMVASGISEALVTTETGLIVALPGVFFQYFVQRRFESFQNFLAQMETVCAQSIYRKSRAKRHLRVTEVARAEIAAKLRAAAS